MPIATLIESDLRDCPGGITPGASDRGRSRPCRARASRARAGRPRGPHGALAGVVGTRGGGGLQVPRRDAAVGAPGGRSRARARRTARRAVHGHGLGQVAGVPAPGADLGRDGASRTAARSDRALPQPDQGARAGPARRSGPPGRPGPRRVHGRRRQLARAASVGAGARGVRPDQPRPAPPRAPARPPALGRVPLAPAVRRRGRVPPLPRRVRRPRGRRAPAAASRLPGVRRVPDLRARLRHGAGPGHLGRRPDRAGLRGCRRGHLGPGPGDPGPVGAAPARRGWRARRPDPALDGRRERRPAGRPRGGRRADAGLRAVPQGG